MTDEKITTEEFNERIKRWINKMNGMMLESSRDDGVSQIIKMTFLADMIDRYFNELRKRVDREEINRTTNFVNEWLRHNTQINVSEDREEVRRILEENE